MTASYRSLMRCPKCYKKGVSSRYRNPGEDHYACRYCDWYAYAAGWDDSDVLGRNQLARLNPDHPLAPAIVRPDPVVES